MIKPNEFALPTLTAEAGVVVTAGAPDVDSAECLEFSLEVLLAEAGLLVLAGSSYAETTKASEEPKSSSDEAEKKSE